MKTRQHHPCRAEAKVAMHFSWFGTAAPPSEGGANGIAATAPSLVLQNLNLHLRLLQNLHLPLLQKEGQPRRINKCIATINAAWQGWCCTFFLLWASPALCQTIHYSVAMPQPASHIFRVEMTIDHPGTPTV